MPLLTQSNVGGISVIPSNVNLRRNITLATAGGGAVTTTNNPTLYVNGLPQLQLWTQQDALSAGLSCTAKLEFSVRQVGGTEEWLTLAEFAIPAAGVPGLFAFVMPCNAIRLELTGGPGWARDVTVDYVLAAFGP